MTAIVVDAAVVVDFLVDVSAGAAIVRARLLGEASPWVAPELMDAEVAHVLRRQVVRGDISSAVADLALTELIALPVQRYPHRPLLARAFALRDNATVYDALYIALAEALDVPLLTRDRALACVPGVAVPVEVIAPVG